MIRWVLGRVLARAAATVLAGAALAVAATGAADAQVPDGPRLAFTKLRHDPTRFELATVGQSGEAYRRVLAMSLPRRRRFVGFDSPAWSPDGSLLAFRPVARRPSLLSIVSSDGGERRSVPNTRGGFLPVFSPDGQTLAFSRFRRKVFGNHTPSGRRNLSHREFESSSVWTVDLATGERRQLTPWRDGLDQYASSYSPDGSTLLLTRIDEARSQEPELVALPAGGGHPKLLVGEGSLPVYSPDGSKIALFRQHRSWGRTKWPPGDRTVVEKHTELYVVDADGTHLRRLTRTPRRDELFASWNPSGERLAYLQLHPGHSEAVSAGFGDSIMQINADGTCETEILSAPHTALYGPTWQPGPGREAGRISCPFGSKGSGNGQLKSPADVEVDSSNGNLLVADNGNHRIQRFDSAGRYLGQFGRRGSGNGQFIAPAAVAIDSEGNIWVGDSGNHRIQKFNSKGKYLLKCGSKGVDNGQFSRWGPKGIAVDSEDNVWVTDYSGRVQQFSSSCKYQDQFGSTGTGKGQFVESAGIDIGPDGRIWVSEWKVSHHVSVFSASGKFLFDFGSEGSRAGQFTHPDGVEVDSEGKVWVLDEGNSRVQQFDQNGRYETQFGASGKGKGQFDFAWPGGLTSDGRGGILVTDTGNNRIQRWINRCGVGLVPAPVGGGPSEC